MNKDEEFYDAYWRFVSLLGANNFRDIKSIEEAQDMRIMAESISKWVHEETAHLFEGRKMNDDISYKTN